MYRSVECRKTSAGDKAGQRKWEFDICMKIDEVGRVSCSYFSSTNHDQNNPG